MGAIIAELGSIVTVSFDATGGVETTVHATRLDMLLHGLTTRSVGAKGEAGWGSEDHLTTLKAISLELDMTIAKVVEERRQEKELEHVYRIWDSSLDCTKCPSYNRYPRFDECGDEIDKGVECCVLAAEMDALECPILKASREAQRPEPEEE